MSLAFEKRQHPRTLHAEDAPVVTGRIRPGLPIRVVDLSDGGGLIETSARLQPGASVDLYLECATWRARIRARVVRCAVGSLSPARIIFRGALQFETPLLRTERFIHRAESVVDAVCSETREVYGSDGVPPREVN